MSIEELSAIPADAPLAAELACDDVVETANLTSAQTGAPGTISISTAMGSHGPRVNYFVQPGRTQPSFSVSIADVPAVVANSLPARTIRQIAPQVIEWVRRNKGDLPISGTAAIAGRSRRSTPLSSDCAGYEKKAGQTASARISDDPRDRIPGARRGPLFHRLDCGLVGPGFRRDCVG